MDVLRQSKPISKESQITYYENHIWPQLNSDTPTQILFAYKYKKKLIVRISENLGNQLFMYANAFNIAKKCNFKFNHCQKQPRKGLQKARIKPR